MGKIHHGTLEQLDLIPRQVNPVEELEFVSDETIKAIRSEELIDYKEIIVEKIVEKQVPVEKEVIVEKIVEKIVEVPVEVIKEVKVLDKELLVQEVARLDARLEEMNDLVESIPGPYNDSELKKELHDLKEKNVKLMILLGMVSLLALVGVVF